MHTYGEEEARHREVALLPAVPVAQPDAGYT